MNPEKIRTQNQNILFYDGECSFCNFWVQFFSDRDRNKQIYFAPLQGTTAKNILPQNLITQPETLVFYYQGQFLTKSSAILRALREIQYSPDLLFVIKLIPLSILNSIYDFIARHRHHFFKKNSFCPIPTEELKKQLLG